MRKIGNQPEVTKYEDADQTLICELDPNGFFSQWKKKVTETYSTYHCISISLEATLSVILLLFQFPSVVLQKMGMGGKQKKKSYTDNTLGLLRFNRNLHEH